MPLEEVVHLEVVPVSSISPVTRPCLFIILVQSQLWSLLISYISYKVFLNSTSCVYLLQLASSSPPGQSTIWSQIWSTVKRVELSAHTNLDDAKGQTVKIVRKNLYKAVFAKATRKARNSAALNM